MDLTYHSDKRLLSWIEALRSSLTIEQPVDYRAADQERLLWLIAEAERRGLVVPK
jgi:hypothetical protein